MWSDSDLERFDEARELEVSVVHRNGRAGSWTPIWVVRVGDRAWPLTRLTQAGEIVEEGVTIRWTRGQASALDSAEIAQGREVGNIRVRDASGADLPHDVMFAFAFHAFFPEGEWMVER